MATERHNVVIGVEYTGQQGFQRYMRDVQDLLRALQTLGGVSEMVSRQTRALPGRGPQPRTADYGLPGPSRFMSRDRAFELQQEQFTRALRQRVEAERVATQAALESARAQRFQQRVAAIGDRATVSGVSFGAGGNPQFEFALTSAGEQLRTMTARLQRINASLAGVEGQFNPSRQAVNQQAYEVNRAALDRKIDRYISDQESGGTTGSQHQADALRQYLNSVHRTSPEGRALFYQGEANSTLLNKLTPEQRQILIGTMDSAKSLGATAKYGIPIPGLYNQGDARSHLFDEWSHNSGSWQGLNAQRQVLQQQLANLQRTVQSYVLPPGSPQARQPLAITSGRAPLAITTGRDAEGFETYDAYMARQRTASMRAAREETEFRERIVEQARRALNRAEVQNRADRAAMGTAGTTPIAMGGNLSALLNRYGGGFFGGGGGLPPRPPGGSFGDSEWFDDMEGAGRDWTEAIDAQTRRMDPESFSTLFRAQNRLSNAHDRLADVIAKGDLGIGEKGGYATESARAQAYRSALQNLDAANQNLTKVLEARQAAERQAASAATRTAAAGGGIGGGPGGPFGPPGTLGGDFMYGFRGDRNSASYAEQVGQTFKFGLLYGTAYRVLFGITATMAATLQEGIAFQEGMTNLAIATERPKEELETIASELGRSATRAGFAPSQGVEIGARSLGLYGAVGEDAAIQDRVMRISSRVVNQLAVGSTKTPVELQGDIAAIAQALGLGAAGQFRIADLDAYMTKQFGIAQGATLETVAQSASVGKAAGFTDEELFAIAADMISRTGQTPSAVAGFMAQIFSRGGEGSLVDVARRQGIDPTQELQAIIGQLAEIYKTASPQEQAEISAAFGRGKIQNAAVALLSDYAEVREKSRAAEGGAATGVADRTFEERMNNIGGELAQLSGVLREFASLLGESGMLDILGLAVITLREFVEGVNGVLRLWNEMPRVLRDVLIALGAIGAMAKMGVFASGYQALLTRAGGAAPGVGRGLALAGAGLGAGGLTAAGTATGAAGLRAAGAAAWGLIGPIGLAIGGLVAIGALKNSADRMRDAMTAADEVSLGGGPGVGAGSSALTAYASELRSTARLNADATGRFAQIVSFGQADNDNQRIASELRVEARRIEALAAAARQREAQVPSTSAVFAGTTAEDITTGLDNLANSGVTAADQLAALRDVLFGTADAAQAAAESFDREEFSGLASQGLRKAIADSLKGFEIEPEAVTAGAPVGRGPMSRRYAGIKGEDLRGSLRDYLSGTEAADRMQRGLNEFNVDQASDLLDPGVAEGIAKIVGRGVADNILKANGFDPNSAEGKDLKGRINAAIINFIRGQGRGARDLISGRGPLSTTDATTAAQSALQLSDETLGGFAQIDNRGRIGELRNRIGTLRRIQSRAPEPIGIIQEAIADARRQIAENQFNELERLRRVAQQNADSKREIAQIGRGFLRREIQAAVRGRNADLLVTILEQAGRSGIEMARQTILDALAIARAAGRASDALAQFGDQVVGEIGAFRQAAQNKEKKGIKSLLGMLDSLSTALSATGDDDVYTSGRDSGNPNFPKWDKEESEAEKEKDSLAQINAARAQAYATRSQGSMDAARAAIQSAKANLADAKKNTVEYWNAMGELFAAQNQLNEAVLAYRKNQMLLNIDMTNPLAVARVETRAAAMKLREDMRNGAAADVIAQDRIDVRSARANEEATRFSQRLQAVQTAEELGRISHSKYINYLENEKNRLERIKNRTFQQQSQLDQIDKLLQDASKTMQGQFNLGDIRLPTPYQVRRYIAESSGTGVYKAAAGAGQQNVNINVNGADTAKVTQIIQQVVGKSARTRTVTPRRR